MITGVYPDVRASLLARGWVENPDPDSSFFDLKWCLRTRSIYNPPLLRHQIVNHYSGAGACLTTKYGLLESIQHIRWYFDVNVGTFFPRAMKLGTPAEFQALETEFKWCAAASILRRLLLDNGLSHEGVPSAEHVQLAMKVCRQQTAFRKDLIDDDAADGALPSLPVMPEDKWAMLLACPCFKNCQLTPTGPSRPNSRPSSGELPCHPCSVLPCPVLLCPALPCCALPAMPYMGLALCLSLALHGVGLPCSSLKPCCPCAQQASQLLLDCPTHISAIQERQNFVASTILYTQLHADNACRR